MNSLAKHPAQAALTKIRTDPVWFIEDAFNIRLWGKQRLICKSVRDNRNTSVRSCHGSGKSFSAGHIVHWFLQAYPGSIVLTTAPTFRQVEDVLWKEIRAAHWKAKIDLGGKINSVSYTLAPDWYAVGLSTNEPDRFQGYHAPYILVIIDESSGVGAEIKEAIQGVASTGYVRILELGNPTDPTGPFAQTFKSPFYHNIEISCFDTPNFKPFRVLQSDGQLNEEASVAMLRESTEEQREAGVTHQFLISPEWVYQRMVEWGVDTPMFQSRCLGHFPDEGDDTLIPLRYALQAKWYMRDNGHLECQNSTYGEEEVLGVDVARYGSDQTVFAYRKGNKVESIIRYRKQSLMKTVSDIVHWKIAHPWGKVHVDDTGVGGGVTDRLKELDVEGVWGINVGEAARDKEQFLNKRAELYWGLKVRFRDGDIAIPDDDKLVADLTAMKVIFKSSGKIQIESKDDMRKRGISSPDSADAVMLAFAPSAIGTLNFGPEEEVEEEPNEPTLPKSTDNTTGDLLNKIY